MDFTPSLNAKQFFRFTGPPENWLTAIKFMTWGLIRDYEERWKKIQPGDVFFIHSTASATKDRDTFAFLHANNIDSIPGGSKI